MDAGSKKNTSLPLGGFLYLPTYILIVHLGNFCAPFNTQLNTVRDLC